MVSLHGFSIPILLTQSNLKSALLFSCTSPFSGACVYYIPFRRKSQTYVCVFLRKCKKIFRSYPQFKSEKQESMPLYNENPHAAMTKGAPQAGQRGRLFRGGLCCNDVFLLLYPFGFGGLSLPVRPVVVQSVSGVSLSAAARSADALVYDKLTPNCHSVKINRLRTKIDTSYGYSLYGNL